MEIIPLPITKMKIPKDKWLSKPVKYEEELTIKDVLEYMVDKTYDWINDKSDLSFFTDYDSLKTDFINLMYDNSEEYMNYMGESEEELFDLKYLEEISELFNEFKTIDNYYNTEIIKGDFNDLFEFIKSHTIIEEFSDDEFSEDDLQED